MSDINARKWTVGENITSVKMNEISDSLLYLEESITALTTATENRDNVLNTRIQELINFEVSEPTTTWEKKEETIKFCTLKINLTIPGDLNSSKTQSNKKTLTGAEAVKALFKSQKDR